MGEWLRSYHLSCEQPGEQKKRQATSSSRGGAILGTAAVALLVALIYFVPSTGTRPVRVESVRVLGDQVNVRATPSASGSVIAKVHRGTVLIKKRHLGDWTEVDTSSISQGASGWIFTELLAPAGK